MLMEVYKPWSLSKGDTDTGVHVMQDLELLKSNVKLGRA